MYILDGFSNIIEKNKKKQVSKCVKVCQKHTHSYKGKEKINEFFFLFKVRCPCTIHINYCIQLHANESNDPLKHFQGTWIR